MKTQVSNGHIQWLIFSDMFHLLCLLFTELDSKLQAAETRCKVLEKQLGYMKKMVESVKKERISVMENQVFLEQINMVQNAWNVSLQFKT